MEQGEFRMLTDVSAAAPKELLFNYDELKAFLSGALEEYRGIVVTEDTVPDAKVKRATVNKAAKAISDQRIAVKKQLLAVYDSDFKPKCDELEGMCAEVAKSIDGQIKAFEQREKDAKIARLRAIYDAGEAEARSYLPWEALYCERWGNKGYAEDVAAEEINGALEKVLGDLAAIRDLGGQDTAYLLDYYRQGHDMSAVVRKSSELASMRAAEEQRRREAAEAEEKRRAAEQSVKETDCHVAAGAAPRNDNDSAPRGNGGAAEPQPEQDEAVHIIDFRVWATSAQLDMLKGFLTGNGIRYGRVPGA